MRINKSNVEALEYKGKRVEVYDDELTGFYVRVGEDTKTYWVRYYLKGRRRRLKIGRHPQIAADIARRQATKIFGLVADGKDPAAERADERRRENIPTLSEFIEKEYKEHVLSKNKSGESMWKRLKAICGKLGEKRLDQITTLDIERWRAERKKKVRPATSDRDLNGLKSLFSLATKANYITDNPAEAVKLDRPESKRIRYLSTDEDRRLIAALEARRKVHNSSGNRGEYTDLETDRRFFDYIEALVLLALNTGCRRGELFGLTWTDVNFDQETITVRADVSKTSKSRHVPLNQKALRVLTCWRPKEKRQGLVFPGPNGERLGSIKTAWSELMRAAQIEDFRFHDCRHDFASKLVMRGVEMYALSQLLGHADLKMTTRYAHLAPDHLRQAISVLDQREAERVSPQAM